MELTYQYDQLSSQYKEQVDQEKELRLLHENIRHLKHDMKNHMLVLASYLNQDNVEEAKAYLTKVMDKLNQIYTYIETGNSVLNTSINAKLEQAKQKGITFKAEIENLSFSKLTSMDLAAIIMNLLDNAIESCLKEERKELEIQVVQKRGYDTIQIKNWISHSVLSDNPELHTTKCKDAKNHGIGILQVRELVTQYDGIIDFYEEKKWFCCFVAFPR